MANKKDDKKIKEVKETKNKKSFMKSFKAELKKVIWPSKKQLRNSTLAVLAIVCVTTIIVFALDLVFDNINKAGTTIIENLVENYQSDESTDTTETTDENTEATEILVDSTETTEDVEVEVTTD